MKENNKLQFIDTCILLYAYDNSEPELDSILEAITIQQRYKISFWDAMIICSAKTLGCKIIWTEDLNNKQYYEDIQVLNPFS